MVQQSKMARKDSAIKKADEYVKEWQLLPGKEFSDFFGIVYPGNLTGIPKFKHRHLIGAGAGGLFWLHQ